MSCGVCCDDTRLAKDLSLAYGHRIALVTRRLHIDVARLDVGVGILPRAEQAEIRAVRRGELRAQRRLLFAAADDPEREAVLRRELPADVEQQAVALARREPPHGHEERALRGLLRVGGPLCRPGADGVRVDGVVQHAQVPGIPDGLGHTAPHGLGHADDGVEGGHTGALLRVAAEMPVGPAQGLVIGVHPGEFFLRAQARGEAHAGPLLHRDHAVPAPQAQQHALKEHTACPLPEPAEREAPALALPEGIAAKARARRVIPGQLLPTARRGVDRKGSAVGGKIRRDALQYLFGAAAAESVVQKQDLLAHRSAPPQQAAELAADLVAQELPLLPMQDQEEVAHKAEPRRERRADKPVQPRGGDVDHPAHAEADRAHQCEGQDALADLREELPARQADVLGGVGQVVETGDQQRAEEVRAQDGVDAEVRGLEQQVHRAQIQKAVADHDEGVLPHLVGDGEDLVERLHGPGDAGVEDGQDREDIEQLRRLRGHPEGIERRAHRDEDRVRQRHEQAHEAHRALRGLLHALAIALGVETHEVGGEDVGDGGVEVDDDVRHGLGHGEVAHGRRADEEVCDQQVELVGQEIRQLRDAVPDAGGEDRPDAAQREVREAEAQVRRELSRVVEVRADGEDRGDKASADHEAQPRLEGEEQPKHRDGVEDAGLGSAQRGEIEGVGDVVAVGVDGEKELEDKVREGQGVGELDLPDQGGRDLKERVEMAHAQQRRQDEHRGEDRVGHAHGGEVLPGLLGVAAGALEHDETARHGVERDREERGVAGKVVRELHVAVAVAAELTCDARRDIETDEEIQHKSHDAEHDVLRQRPAAEISGFGVRHGRPLLLPENLVVDFVQIGPEEQIAVVAHPGLEARAGQQVGLAPPAFEVVAESGLALVGVVDGHVQQPVGRREALPLLAACAEILHLFFPAAERGLVVPGRAVVDDTRPVLVIGVDHAAAEGDAAALVIELVGGGLVLVQAPDREGVRAQQRRGIELAPGGHEGHVPVVAHQGEAGLLRREEAHALLGLGREILAAVVDLAPGTDGDVGPAVREQRQQIRDRVRGDVVVVVHEEDVVARGVRDAVVARVGETSVGLVQGADARVLFGPGVAERGAAVGRAVVHEQDLEPLVALADQALHAAAEQVLGLVDGDDHGNERRVHRETPLDQNAAAAHLTADRRVHYTEKNAGKG